MRNLKTELEETLEVILSSFPPDVVVCCASPAVGQRQRALGGGGQAAPGQHVPCRVALGSTSLFRTRRPGSVLWGSVKTSRDWTSPIVLTRHGSQQSSGPVIALVNFQINIDSALKEAPPAQ